VKDSNEREKAGLETGTRADGKGHLETVEAVEKTVERDGRKRRKGGVQYLTSQVNRPVS